MRYKLILSLLFSLLLLPISIQGQEKASVEKLMEIDSLASLCWAQRESNTDQALVLGIRAVTLAAKYKVLDRSAKINNYIGAIYLHYLFDHQTAIPYLNQALTNAFQANNSTQIGYAYNNLGDAFYLNANPTMAMEYGRLSLKYFEKAQDQAGIAYSYVNLGLAHRLNHHLDSANHFFWKSYEIGVELQEQNRMASSLLEIGNTLLEADSLEKAKEIFDKALELHVSVDNMTYAVMSLVGLGEVSYQQNRMNNAQAYFEKALEIDNKSPNLFNQVSIMLNLALINGFTGDQELGKAHLSKAFAFARELGLSSKVLECYEKSYEFYKYIADYKSASEAIMAFVTTSDSIFHSHQIETLEKSKERFEILQVNLEDRMKLENKRRELKYALLIVFLLLVIAIILFFRSQSKIRYNRELKEMNEAKDKLFSIISHDLRNPFVALIQYVDLLKEGDMTEEMRTIFIEDLDQKTKSTYQLLENLLNLSASRTGKISFQPKSLDSLPLVKEILRQVKPQLDQKELKITLDMDGKAIYGDQNMISLVIRNLISNAIKYSLPGKKILIHLKTDLDQSILKVKDQGQGIAKNKIANLFNAEFTESTQGTEGEKGTGIGLSLCKEFVDRHEGQIYVDSVVGYGSTFSVFLPIK